ncbi:hypothetical protein RRG08_053533 [Elysia crispata]|uniref:Uncharacterized protein n=1 Tax=Elysia crispata TaxID=231223 RepID=A0AAE0YBB3_9GAST|nr:hypothetical protein RRG08_053533 [Elysia crispata]
MERLEAGSQLLPACSEQQERRRGQRRGRGFYCSPSLLPKPAWFRIVAANQQSISYSGYFVVVGDEVVTGCVAFVVINSIERCILGMNVLRQLTNIGLGPFPSPEPPPSSPKLARTPKTPTHIPPCSTQVLTLTGTDPSFLPYVSHPTICRKSAPKLKI